MRIIDAHLHLGKSEYFDEIALAAGHENTSEHLRQAFAEHGICGGVVMGNRDLSLESHHYPDFLRYCIGLDNSCLEKYSLADATDLVAAHLQRQNCVGIKLYPGYQSSYVYDACYQPFMELAQRMDKPVAIHTGATAGPNALLKYCHPLTVDKVATRHPKVQFVMCHFGNPWLVDSAAVMEKNHNVSADLSGLVGGNPNRPALLRNQRGYWQQLCSWMEYAGDYGRFMYGTDWPLVNVELYLRLMQDIVPYQQWEKVFYENANRIYQLGM